MPMICRSGDRSSCWKINGEIDHHRARALTKELEQEIDLRLAARVLKMAGIHKLIEMQE